MASKNGETPKCSNTNGASNLSTNFKVIDMNNVAKNNGNNTQASAKNAMAFMAGAEVTMSSLDFLNNIINPARVSEGECAHEPRKFLLKIEDELDQDGTGKKFRLNNNQTKTAYYDLNLDQLTLVGMRESKAVRRSVLEKLKVLSKPKMDLNDPEFLRGTLLTYTEKVIALEHKVEEMQPDVEALERIAKADGSMCITNAAKHLQVQPKLLFKHLSENQWIYRRTGGKNWLAYQNRIQSGLLEHKVTTVERSDGSEKVVEQCLVTAKGIAKIAKMLGVTGVAA